MMTSFPAAKRPTLRLLHLNNIPIFNQLKLEEALLRADSGNWCLLNTGSPPAIVLGISGKPELLVDVEHAQRCSLPLIKRFSGGGTVYIDQNTVFATWICNAHEVGADCFPERVHRWAADFYHQAFPDLGMTLRENDYVIGEKKWGGNAQYLAKGRWLHHTSILWDCDPEAMKVLLQPKKAPAYRRERSHEQFLMHLKDYFPRKEELERQIIGAAHRRFEVVATTIAEAESIALRPHRSSTHFLS